MVKISSISLMWTTDNLSSLSPLPKSLSAGDHLSTIPSDSDDMTQVTAAAEGFVGCNSTHGKGKGGDYKLKSPN